MFKNWFMMAGLLMVGATLSLADVRIPTSDEDDAILDGSYSDIQQKDNSLDNFSFDIRALNNQDWDTLATSNLRELKILGLAKSGRGDQIIGSEFQELSPLWKARTLFYMGKDEEAVEEYLKIKLNSSEFYQAQIEMALAAVVNHQIRRAIGILHVLNSPYFEFEMRATLYHSLGIAYLNLCQYGESEVYFLKGHEEIQRWKKGLGRLSAMDDRELLKEVRRTLESASGKHNLILRKPLVSGRVLMALLDWNSSIKRQEEIRNRLKVAASRKEYWFHRATVERSKVNEIPYGSMVEKRIAMKRAEAFESFSEQFSGSVEKISDVLQVAAEDIQPRLERKKTEFIDQLRASMNQRQEQLASIAVNIELARAESRLLYARNLDFKEVGDLTTLRNLPSRQATWREQAWPFESELWKDELGNYYSVSKDECEKRFSEEQDEMFQKEIQGMVTKMRPKSSVARFQKEGSPAF